MFSKTKERTAQSINYKIMKLFKKNRLLMLVCFSALLILSSCSQEDSVNTESNESSKISFYLKTFYSTNFKFGKSVEIKTPSNFSMLNRTTEAEDFAITEVFVGNDTRARGYIVTDISTNEFLYFIDVDRFDFKLTAVNIDANDTKIFNDIDNLNDYISTNELDYIKIAEDYSTEIENGGERRPFWGWGGWQTVGGCDSGWQSVINVYHVFWIKTTLIDYNEIPC